MLLLIALLTSAHADAADPWTAISAATEELEEVLLSPPAESGFTTEEAALNDVGEKISALEAQISALEEQLADIPAAAHLLARNRLQLELANAIAASGPHTIIGMLRPEQLAELEDLHAYDLLDVAGDARGERAEAARVAAGLSWTLLLVCAVREPGYEGPAWSGLQTAAPLLHTLSPLIALDGRGDPLLDTALDWTRRVDDARLAIRLALAEALIADQEIPVGAETVLAGLVDAGANHREPASRGLALRYARDIVDRGLAGDAQVARALHLLVYGDAEVPDDGADAATARAFARRLVGMGGDGALYGLIDEMEPDEAEPLLKQLAMRRDVTEAILANVALARRASTDGRLGDAYDHAVAALALIANEPALIRGEEPPPWARRLPAELERHLLAASGSGYAPVAALVEWLRQDWEAFLAPDGGPIPKLSSHTEG